MPIPIFVVILECLNFLTLPEKLRDNPGEGGV